jgi:DNA-binding NarL/FixJ family response regulator
MVSLTQPAYLFYSMRPVRDRRVRRSVIPMVTPGDPTARTSVSDRIRVIVADGHALFRQALRSILEDQPDIVVVAEASDVAQVLSEAERTEPDVILLDEHLSVGSVGHTAALLRASVPGCQVVVLAVDEDDAGLLAAVEAGVTGYLTKDVGVVDLLEGTRVVHRGEALIPGRMLGTLLTTLLERRRREREALLRISRLTVRERQVLELLAAGAKNRAIAGALMISPDTARTHVQNLLYKLGLHSRLEAAGFARQADLVATAVSDAAVGEARRGRARVRESSGTGGSARAVLGPADKDSQA